jgi:DNA-binding response OmpR family regulator
MRHLLLAEDNPGDVMLVREALRTSTIAADLVVAYDGEEALRFLANQRFDLFILDLNIPKADGHTILKKVGRRASPPIVVFTSSSNPSERERALAAGAKDYVVKPTDLEDFMKAVHGILERWSGASQSGIMMSNFVGRVWQTLVRRAQGMASFRQLPVFLIAAKSGISSDGSWNMRATSKMNPFRPPLDHIAPYLS